MKYTSPDNLPILDALALCFPQNSKTSLRSWLKEGRISVDGSLVKNNTFIVSRGQTISVGQRPRFADGNLRILYEDKHLVVVEKPEGMLSVSTDFEKADTAHASLKRKYIPNPVYVVHRLDQDTSGVMVFALTRNALDGLKQIFEEHALNRQYVGIVEGIVKENSGTWQCFLYEDSRYYVRKTENPSKGELAITHFTRKDSKKGYSFMEFTLETGKKNQIRVHCQEAGHPVAGDKKYGAETNPLKRLCLHAHKLEFHHPITGKQMSFTSPVPESFYALGTHGHA
jgi:23S rRNA pseudouridine1911/1915/1917 synthase